MQIYKENILDHYKYPRNFGRLKNATHKGKEVNTLCGDEIEIQLKIVSNKIKDIKFFGKGCAISQASASILTESVKGKHLRQIEKLNKEKLLDLLGIPISPTRLKCALLSLYALKKAIKNSKKI